MSNYTLTETRTLSTLTCSECQVLFALDDAFIRQRHSDRKTWYCPNGHSQWYPGKTDEQRVKEAQAQMEAAQATARMLRKQVSTERASHAATKGQLTRKRKELERVGHGVCPVKGCRRHFANVAAHIERQHPDYSQED